MPEGQETDQASQKHQQQNQDGTVHKILIRQNEYDRICPGIKKPVIVAEKQLMKGSKKSLPVHCSQNSQDCRDPQSQNACDPQIGVASFPPCRMIPIRDTRKLPMHKY